MQQIGRARAAGASWSGHERNHVFFGGLDGNQFADISGVSGLDDIADGRSFALLDFDRDGWLDIALANRNTPRLRLFRNRLGDGPDGLQGDIIAFRFVGGNSQPRPTREWSARDGFGASVELELNDELTVYREHQTESSFRAQNSATMVVGIGAHEVARAVTVRWLSGKVLETTDIPAGTLVTVYEDPSTSPTGESFVLEPYRIEPSRMTALPPSDRWRAGLLPEVPSSISFAVNDAGSGNPPRPAKLMLYTTMATWCIACRSEIPEFHQLRDAFDDEQLAIYGLPIWFDDTDQMLRGWATDLQVPYDLLIGLPQEEVQKVGRVVLSELWIEGTEAVPAAIVTDGSGQVLVARWGVPTVSDLKRLLWLAEETR